MLGAAGISLLKYKKNYREAQIMMQGKREESLMKFFWSVVAYLLLVISCYLIDRLYGGYLFTVGSLIVNAGIFIKKGLGYDNSYKKGWLVIEVSVEDVRKAVRSYSELLPKGVYRTILIQDDNSIDSKLLAPFLHGIPSRKFYMSRETYDIFEENEKEIANILDQVQRAVDLYVKEHKEYPVIQYDPLNRVNFPQLLQARCLDTQPDIELYITNYDGLITHLKPKNNSSGL
jgi:hypothetical protein